MEVRDKRAINVFYSLLGKMVILIFAITVGITIPKGAQAANPSVTVSRTADVVFVIDTTGSMGDEIADVKRNINKFIDSVSAENVDVRFRLVSFRDGGKYTGTAKYNNPIIYPSESTWYDKNSVSDAKNTLESGPFKELGGGGWGESPLVPMADLVENSSTYFAIPGTGKTSTAQFCVLITDEQYEQPTHYTGYVDPTDSSSGTKEFGAANYFDTLDGRTGLPQGAKGIVEEMAKKGIHTSVVTKSYLFSTFGKFVTKPTVSSGDDGGMLADIDGDFDILFEKLAEKVIKQTEVKVKQEVSKKLYRKPLKICANMFVLKKEPGCKYDITEGEVKEDGTEDANYTWTSEQTSCVFKGLKPSTVYSVRVKDNNGIIDRYTVETESTTGARYSEIPKVVYEGEVYNIKLDETLRKLMVTSGSAITWSCASDCVSVTKDRVGNGCQMSVVDCQYNRNRLIKASLVANVTYSVSNQKGGYTQKTKKYSQTFSIENTIDALDIGTFQGSTENTMKDGVIVLTSTEKVKLDMIINQGEERDTASRQKMRYYISDEYGKLNKKGSRIATVKSDGSIKGIHAGVTYVTIAPEHTYNKYSKEYEFKYTIPIVCPETIDVSFDEEELKKVDPNLFSYVVDSNEGGTPVYALNGYVKSKFNIREYLKYNSTIASPAVFNPGKMKQEWVSSDSSVARVSSSGNIICKSPGYATITVTPVGGLKISALTGKRDVNAKLCNTSILLKVVEKPKD